MRTVFFCDEMVAMKPHGRNHIWKIYDMKSENNFDEDDEDEDDDYQPGYQLILIYSLLPHNYFLVIWGNYVLFIHVCEIRY